MGLEVRRAISLHKKAFITEDRFFNSLIDSAIGGGIDQVMTRVPTDYLVRFRDWLDRQPCTETLLDLRSGPVSRQDRDAVAAIREWLDHHIGGEAGSGDATRTQEPSKALQGHRARDHTAKEPTRPVGS